MLLGFKPLIDYSLSDPFNLEPPAKFYLEKFNILRSKNRPAWFFEKQCDTYDNALSYINIMVENNHTDEFKIEKVFLWSKR